MGAIFISYRRDDTEGQAGRLFEDLGRHFGKDAVFMDVAAIEPGRDFRRAIDHQVAACSVLLALVGRKWLDSEDGSGNRRLNDPMDFVRLETASALRRDIPVVPVLVHGAKMPQADQLPEDLAEFAFRNAVELTHARWESDVQVLIRALRPHVQSADGTAVQSPPSPQMALASVPGRTSVVTSAVAAVALAVGGLAWWTIGSAARPTSGAPSVAQAAGALDAMAQANPSSARSAALPGSAVVATKDSTGPEATGKPVVQVRPSVTTSTKRPTQDGHAMPRTEPTPVPSPASVRDAEPLQVKRIDLKGNWAAEGCTLVITQDDGHDIRGHCNAGIEHWLSGHYVSKDTASITVKRINHQTSCTLTVTGTIKVLGPDAVRYRQEGWKGCDSLNTAQYEKVLERQ